MAETKFIQKARGLTDHFTIIPNELSQNKALSWKARGLLVYLLSMPENWRIRKCELWEGHRHSTDGRDATASAFKELENNGYITTSKKKGTATSPPETLYFVHWTPVQVSRNGVPTDEKPSAGNPATGELSSGKPADGNSAAIKNTTPKETSIKETSQSTHVAWANDFEIKLFELFVDNLGVTQGSKDCVFLERWIRAGGAAEKLTRFKAYLDYKRTSGQQLHLTATAYISNGSQIAWESRQNSLSGSDGKASPKEKVLNGLVQSHQQRYGSVPKGNTNSAAILPKDIYYTDHF